MLLLLILFRKLNVIGQVKLGNCNITIFQKALQLVIGNCVMITFSMYITDIYVCVYVCVCMCISCTYVYIFMCA